jgi:hypothetical protein
MNSKKMLVILCLAVFSSYGLCAASGSANDEAVRAKVELIMGKAYVKEEKKWKPLQMNDILMREDTVKVAVGGSLKLKLSNGNLIDVAGGKTLRLESVMDADTGRKGNMTSLIRKLGKSYSDGGVTAVAGVRGADISKQKKKVKTDDLNWKK